VGPTIQGIGGCGVFFPSKETTPPARGPPGGGREGAGAAWRLRSPPAGGSPGPAPPPQPPAQPLLSTPRGVWAVAQPPAQVAREAAAVEQPLESSKGQADRFAFANPHPKNHPRASCTADARPVETRVVGQKTSMQRSSQ